MDHENMRYFRTVLHSRLHDLLPEIDGVLTELKAGGEHQDPMDEVDQTCARNAQELKMRLGHRHRRSASDIRAALRRIEKGEFGTCSGCGGDIGIARLKAYPITTVCIDCKRRMETGLRLRAV